MKITPINSANQSFNGYYYFNRPLAERLLNDLHNEVNPKALDYDVLDLMQNVGKSDYNLRAGILDKDIKVVVSDKTHPEIFAISKPVSDMSTPGIIDFITKAFRTISFNKK